MCKSADCPSKDNNPNRSLHLKSVRKVNEIRASKGLPPIDPIDVMPDGFHAKPLGLNSEVRKNRYLRALKSADEAREIFQIVADRYHELFPKEIEKPSFFRWMVNQPEIEIELAKRQFVIATVSRSDTTSTKATNTLMAEKEKLKQTIEVEAKEIDHTQTEEVFQLMADFLNVPVYEVKKLVKTNRIQGASN